MTRCWLLLGCLGLLTVAPLRAADQQPSSAARVDFRKDVYPLLKTHCFACHQGAGASSGHRLDVRAEITGETSGRPVVRVGRSADSKLIQLVSSTAPDRRMPQNRPPLGKEQVALLRAWIDQGLAWDDELLPPLSAQARHWAFQPVRRPEIPRTRHSERVRNPIDAFLFAAQERQGVVPAPEADRRILLRRLYLDLTGLPPRPAEIEAFAADSDPTGYEKVVERLLCSPRHGERWGRHWLDLARYADSEGYESDHVRPYAWRYRDWVVRAIQEDKPYDRFLREQIAGDELIPLTDANLIATGFLAGARLSSNEEDKLRQRNDLLVDIVNATAAVTLGLTLHCAQCHSHKFDPITARDYYRFQGFFVAGGAHNLALSDPELNAAYEAAKPAEYERLAARRKALFEEARAKLVATARAKLSPAQRQALEVADEKRTEPQRRLAQEADLAFQFSEGMVERQITGEPRKEYDALKKQLTALEAKMVDRPQTWGFYSPATSPHRIEVLPMKGFYPPVFDAGMLGRARPYLLRSGDVHARGAEVDVGWPEVFGPTPSRRVTTRPRTALAEWLADPRNPLTARVWANRVWQFHFGRGLVSTPSDFGVKGARPTHPELLDWLASELVRSGWSTRHLHRLIVTSSAYRRASRGDPRNRALDPDNRLWWRWEPRRLEAEAIRDAMLAVSGELDPTVGGAPEADEASSVRRTLYLLQKRQKAPAMQALFDVPTAATESCAQRLTTTVALQSLFVLNNDFTVRRARALAIRVLAEAGSDRRRQTECAFVRVLGRSPDPDEQQAARAFFAEAGQDDPLLPLVQFCQALLGLNEFVYLE